MRSLGENPSEEQMANYMLEVQLFFKNPLSDTF